MLKKLLNKILKDEKLSKEMMNLKNRKDFYDFFVKHGYNSDYDSFEKELGETFRELSDEDLNIILGGKSSLMSKMISSGLAALTLTLSSPSGFSASTDTSNSIQTTSNIKETSSNKLSWTETILEALYTAKDYIKEWLGLADYSKVRDLSLIKALAQVSSDAYDFNYNKNTKKGKSIREKYKDKNVVEVRPKDTSKTTDTIVFEDKIEGYKSIVISFHGTDSISDIYTDINIKNPKEEILGKVDSKEENTKMKLKFHKGFIERYMTYRKNLLKTVQEKIEKNSKSKILVTGHSLGGALATIAAIDLKLNFKKSDIKLVTFCSPRVFIKESQEKVKEFFDKEKIKAIRVWRKDDAIAANPTEAMGYKHIGDSWCINTIPGELSALKSGDKKTFTKEERSWYETIVRIVSFKLLMEYFSWHSIEGIKDDLNHMNKENMDDFLEYNPTDYNGC